MADPVIIGNSILYLGDCFEVLPSLLPADAVITDPPFGIKQHGGMGGCGYDGFGKGVKRRPKQYAGEWDKERPDAEVFKLLLGAAPLHIIWGGNYFSDLLPVSQKWLWWDKLQTMPSYSDGELAWTSLKGSSTKKFTYNGSGLMAREKERVHPTQKPVELMKWCIGFLPNAQIILDPYMGSASTGVACVALGRRFIGIERDEQHFATACRRIEDATRQADLFISPEPKPPAKTEEMFAEVPFQ